ncbi:hypothetical protein [Kitasatospora sp. NPDC048407]|uniref:hypothetical protein n=1 Tax=Kitasatospora sp. NPDC048407 TaxID=3364051 RepID=UPI0037109780
MSTDRTPDHDAAETETVLSLQETATADTDDDVEAHDTACHNCWPPTTEMVV